ncbi:MAG: T9SS type A sorting domain-containing protein, partial [Bacteroidota bacterium]
INAIKWLTYHTIAPSLSGPLNENYTVATQTKFEWTSGNYTKYRIQVSKSEDFKATVIDSLVNFPSIQLSTLNPRTQYFWRVSTIYNEEESSWSDIWNFTTKAYSFSINTGISAVIKIPVNSTNQLFQIGDEIGVFTPQGLCVGSEIWNNKDLEITVWGDNPLTPAIDGIKTGEQFNYRIWQKASGTEQVINCLTYSLGDGKYTPNGTSIISSLKLGLSKAGTITGSTSVCKGQNSVSYSVPTITDATSYIWSIPNGATGSSTTNSIAINYGSSTVSGNITVKGHNDCGDGDISTLPVIINPIPETPIITQIGKILSSNATSGNQWYNQNNPISGATAQDYTITTVGEYTVQVTQKGCVSAPSNMIKDVVTGITSLEFNEKIKVYPNPVSDDLTIEYKGNTDEIKYAIYSSSGQLITTGVLLESSVVHTSSFPSGLYTIKFNTGKTFDFRKVIKHN